MKKKGSKFYSSVGVPMSAIAPAPVSGGGNPKSQSGAQRQRGQRQKLAGTLGLLRRAISSRAFIHKVF